MLLLLYFGPETTMPLASALAAAVGVGLIVWGRVFGFTRTTIRKIRNLLVKK